MAASKQRRTAPNPFGKNDVAVRLDPLGFILAEHLRHRELCQVAEELAAAPHVDRKLASAIADFLETEMAMHVIDEEEDLFPLLRRRAVATDGIERIIGLLSGEHAADEALARTLIDGLRAALDADERHALPQELCNALLAFADRERRHLTVENAIVLPLAAKRLTKRDQRELGRRMAARRGIAVKEPGT